MTRCPGESNGMSKLHDAEVLKIRELYKAGGYTQTKLAKMFGVSCTTVFSIINGYAWKHITKGQYIIPERRAKA